jgi:hypothetical protein
MALRRMTKASQQFRQLPEGKRTRAALAARRTYAACYRAETLGLDGTPRSA